MRSAPLNRKTIMQFVRYGCVGVINTVLTLVVILVCKDLLCINEWVSNAVGYIVGFINSFVWNKLWVFKSRNGMAREMAAFCMGFIICYCIQFIVTWVLSEYTWLKDSVFDFRGFVLSGYGIATLIGMVVYTIANFVYNKVITFSQK